MSKSTRVTRKPRLPFAPENITMTGDGRFIWFDGDQEHDVSDHLVWWRCRHGHEWQESLASKTSHGPGAPCCEQCQ